MGEEKGLAYFRKLAAMKPQIRSGHTLMTELVAAGEIPVALPAPSACPPPDCRASAPPGSRGGQAEGAGSADRLEAAAARIRPGRRHRRGEAGAAPARGAPLRGFRAVARRPALHHGREPRAGESLAFGRQHEIRE